MPRQPQPRQTPAQDPWKPLRTESAGTGTEEDNAPPLPGKRGRYLLYLGPPIIRAIEGRGRFVHFSWSGESYCIRDFIAGVERREGTDFTVEQVWRRATDRIPATGDYYRPHSEGKFWRETLDDMTRVHHSTVENRHMA